MEIRDARKRSMKIFTKEEGHYGYIGPVVGVKVADNYHMNNISDKGIHHIEL